MLYTYDHFHIPWTIKNNKLLDFEMKFESFRRFWKNISSSLIFIITPFDVTDGN